MSDVDKRVVQMDFDNKKFEKNVKQSTQSLNTLKASLDFDGVSDSIDQVSVKISRMEYVAAAAITNITNRIVNLGIQLIKSLSIDNIAAGWTKFGQKTTSVATLMAQTLKVSGKELTDNTEKLSTVNELMNRLMWFTDETSYSFTDMIDNIGKFTAAGLDLDVSTKAMEGIATWAALSGQNASTASRAMYQLSQAMGKGKIQLIDWKSIQNANMDTAEMRKNVLETAVAMGQLTKEGEKYVTKTGKKFTQNQFTEQLSEGWFTSDVLTTTLEKYSNATDEIYKIAQKEGLTASEVLAKYGDTLDEFGVKAFKAAQEARTLSDALTSVKDAVASKWMTTSELIFGDKDEAVQLWTDLANALYDVFAASGDFRNSILEVWKSLGGRDDLFKRGGDDQGAFWNIFDAILAVKQVIKDAWNTIFPLSQMEAESDQAQEIGNSIKQLSSRFKEFTKTLKLSEVNTLRLRKVFEGIFSVFKGLITLVKAAKIIIDPIVDLIKQLTATVLDKLIALFGKINFNGETLLKIADKIRDSLEKLFDQTIDFSGIFATIVKTLKFVANILATTAKKIAAFIKNSALIDKMQIVFEKLRQEFTKLEPILNKVKDAFVVFGKKVSSAVSVVIDSLRKLINSGSAKNINNKLVKPMSKSLAELSTSIDAVVNASESVNEKTNLFGALTELFKSLYDLLIGIVSIGTAVVVLSAKVIQVVGKILQNIGDALVAIVDGNFKLEAWQKSLLTTLAILTPIVVLLALIAKMAYNVFYTMSSIFAPWGALSDSLSGVLDKVGLQMMSNSVKTFATAILQISVSLLIIATINPDRLWPAVGALATIAAILAALVALVIFSQKQANKLATSTKLITTSVTTVKSAISECVYSVKDLIQESKKLLQANAIARVLQSFGAAMLQSALALYIMAKISPDQLWAGVGVFATLTALVMILTAYSKKNEANIKKALPGIGQLLVMAVAIKSVAKTLSVFKDFTDNQMAMMSLGTAVLVAFLSFMLFFLYMIEKINDRTDDVKAMYKTVRVITSMSTLLLGFAVSVKILSTIPWESLGVTLGVIGGFFAEMAGLILLIEMSSKWSASSDSLTDGMKQMLALALAIFSFAVSVSILATIPWATLGVTLGVIGAFFVEFAGLMVALGYTNALYSKIDVGSADKTLGQMKAMIVMLFSFAISMKLLSTIPWATLGVTLGVVGAFFVEFAGLLAALNLASRIGGARVEDIDKLLYGISALLISFSLMAKITETISIPSLFTSVGALALLLGSIGGLFIALAFANKLGKSVSSSTSTIISIIASITAMTVALRVLADIDIDRLWSAVGSLAVLVASFAGLLVLLAEIKGMMAAAISGALALLVFSFSMLVVAGALTMMATQPWDRMLTAAGSMSMVLLAFAAMATVLGKDLRSVMAFNAIAKSFLIFGASLIAVGAALTLVASQPWQQILAATLAIVAVVSTLAGAVALFKLLGVSGEEFLQDMLAMSIGLALFSASILAFAVAIKQFESVDWQTIARALGAVAIQIGVLALAAAITQKIIPAILALASAFLLIGMGMILSATAIQMVISAIATLGTMSSEQLQAVKDSLAGFVSVIGETLSPLVSSFLDTLAANIPTILTIVGEVVSGINSMLATESPKFISTVIDSLTTLITSLAEKSDEIYSGLKTLISGSLKMVKDNAGKWAQDVVDTVIDVVKVLTEKDNVDAIVKELLKFVDNLFISLFENKDMLDSILQNALNLIAWLLVEITKKAVELAGDVAKVSLVVIAAAIQIIIASLGTLSKLFLTFVASLLLIIAYTFSGLGNVLFEVFKVVVKELITTFVDVVIYFQDVLASLGMLLGKLVLRGLIKAFQTFTSWIWDIVYTVSGGQIDVNKALNDAANKMGEEAKSFATNLDGSIKQVQQAIQKTSKNITEVVTFAVEETNAAVTDGLSQITDAVGTAQKKLSSEFKDLGLNIGEGYAEGVEQSTEEANDAAYELTASSVDAGAKGQDSHSPSKKFAKLGLWAVLGYAEGVADNSRVATDSITQMVTKALTAAQDTLDSQNGDDVTIKVGMDISSVEEQSRNISSIMSGISNVTATAYGRNASYNANAMNKGSSGGTVNSTDNSTTVTYNNVINVSSTDPERSADEIDRALSRQATLAKLAHGTV